MLKAWWSKRSCPHVHLRGIYGDEALHTGARLVCADCGRYLRGPVALADWREHESYVLASWRLEYHQSPEEPI